MRESIRAKGLRYVGEQRFTITHVDDHLVTAVCRGTEGLYEISWQPVFGWSCTCQARANCCHLEAMKCLIIR